MSGAVAASALLGVYRQPDITFVSGAGSWLVDEEGRSYLDFTSGIGTNALGFDSPVIRAALLEALDSGLIHTSNLFRTHPGERLARALVEASFPGRVFFCNSGAEAGEAAFKLSRRWAREVGGPGKHEIVAFRGGFHGRLFGTLAATDRPAYQEPFRPLLPGVHIVDLQGPGEVDRVVSSERTAALVVEPVQGEGGVRPVPAATLRALRELCDERRVALVFDEVQCGLGRTGRLFAYEHAGVRPDLLTLAKPLAGGLPMGAVVVGDEVAGAVRPGDHATTFGGGPLVASVALAVVEAVARPGFLAEVRRKGREVERRLRSLAREHAAVVEVRGLGLMWGLELRADAGTVVEAARERGLLLVGAGPGVVRILPPLTVTDEELAHGLDVVQEVLP